MDDSQSAQIRNHLQSARQQLSEGNPQCALRESIAALKLVGKEDVLISTLRNAKETFWNSQKEIDFDDQIEAVTKLMNAVDFTPQKTEDDFSDSILAESGRELMNTCALEDGTCFRCGACGAVVVMSRREAHYRYWCEDSKKN